MKVHLYSGLVLALLLSGPARGAESESPPNLLIIQTDEHNFRTLGCYRALLPPEQALMWGDAVVETPHIDSIARAGVLCTSFYATTPVCSPSRAAFFSGHYPHHTGVVKNDLPLDAEVVTFAELLRRRGYATGYAGKWHLDGPDKPQWAPERTFGFADNRYMFNRGHWKQLEDAADGPRVKTRNRKGKPSYSIEGATRESFTTDFLTDRTIEFIHEHAEVPFCFVVSFPDPHGPDTVRPPYDTMFADQKYEKPRTYDKPDTGLPSWGKKLKCGFDQAAYYGMVRCIDDNVGRILDVLDASDLRENTIVVFTSDHGDLRGEHHRHNKGVPYEGSARIPFLVSYPGRIAPGTTVDAALACVDFAPTILGLMGFESARGCEGRDASALLVTGEAPADWRDVVFLRAIGKPEQGWLAAVTDRYKLVLAPDDPPWLFDLELDPDELENRFLDPACREIVRDLAGALLDYGAEHGDPRVGVPGIRADLEWAVSGSGAYRR